MEKTQKNIPSFGRAKEIAPESQFECFILSEKALTLPKWIRLGKWASKAEVTSEELSNPRQSTGEFTFPYPLNPLDVMFSHQVLSYDTVNMPPVSLIRNVRLQGRYYESEGMKIPAGMQYRFSG
ncbi:MAG TPA: type I-D CRISPR-associated protein Cas5/Csc1, partial [Allocoleopsis sp.]